jgi:hypothetical protein
MATIAIPSPAGIQRFTQRLVRVDVALETFSGSEVIIAPPIAKWMCSFPLTRDPIAINRAWFAALIQLSNLGNTFDIPIPAYVGPGTGYAGGIPAVDGAGQLGLSLTAKSMTFTTAVALAGDFMEVNGEFKVITADVTSDGAGLATFNFEPALRSAPADSLAIDIQSPSLKNMRLVNPVASWDLNATKLYDIAIDAIESY